MSKRKTSDAENRRPFVALYHDEIDSMAFKTLSPNAAWLLVQTRRAWTNEGRYERIELPFVRVSWKLSFPAFDKARRELIEAGFLRVVEAGGLLKKPAVYALSEGWRGEVAKRLADDPEAGYCVNIRAKDGRLISVWYPARSRSESQKNADRARMAKMEKARGAKKPAPAKSKKVHPTPKVYLNRVRVAKLLNERGALGKARELRNRN